jgi:hypothetical protein
MASEAAVLEMEKKAAMRKRMNKAQADFNANNTVHAQNMAREQADNNVMREAASSAHERFMQSHRQFIERNPFAVSPFERKAVLGDHQARQDQAALREHELNMVGKKNEGAIKVAEHNANGMINQGKSAAEINAGVKEKEIETGLKKHELEMQNRKDLATIQANAQKSLAEGQNKTTLENTKLQGENAVKQQSEANKGLLAQSELKEKMEREKREAQVKQKMLELQTKSGIALDKENADIIEKALNKKRFDETEEDVFNRLRKIYKDNPAVLKFIGGAGENSGGVTKSKAKEGDVLTTPSGKKAVFRSGKWVIEG